jgi:hypothetical protein
MRPASWKRLAGEDFLRVPARSGFGARPARLFSPANTSNSAPAPIEHAAKRKKFSLPKRADFYGDRFFWIAFVGEIGNLCASSLEWRPATMRRILCGLILGTAAGVLPVATTNAAESTGAPWQCTIVGRDRGVQFLTFWEDFTLTGYGISLNFVGPFTSAGTWAEGAKDSVIGSFTSYSDRGNQAAIFDARVRPTGGLLAKVTVLNGTQKYKAPAPAAIADLSGVWSGSFRAQGKKPLLAFTLTASTNNMPGWFDLSGTGIGETGSFTLSGAVLVTSDRNAAGYTISNFGTGTTQAAFVGKVGPKANKWTLRGKDENNKTVTFQAQKPKP